MAKVNLSRLSKQACTCQSDKEGWEKQGLVEVKSRHHYERQHDGPDHGEMPSMVNSGPNIPTTDDGTEITFENFPDANLVCPACGKEWLVICDVYPAEEKGERTENTLTDDDWERIEDALKTHAGLTDDEGVKETIEKVK